MMGGESDKINEIVLALRKGERPSPGNVSAERDDYLDKVESWSGLGSGVNSLITTIKSQLDVDWWKRYKQDDETVWDGLTEKVNKVVGGESYWPARMLKQGKTPDQVVESLIPVVILDEFSKEEKKVDKNGGIEVVRGTLVSEKSRPTIKFKEEAEAEEVIDGEVVELQGSGIIDFGEEKSLDGNELEKLRNEFLENNRINHSEKSGFNWKIKNNKAIVQFNGRVIEQVRVQDRNTCILAVAQMLLTHSGYIRGDAHVSLIEAKNEMVQLAKNIGALVDDAGGTLKLHEVEKSVRPVLEEAEKKLLTTGKAESAENLGRMGVEYFDYFDGFRDMEVYDALMVNSGGERVWSASALAIMADKWQNGENIIFGYTHVNQIGERNENGHQRVINGITMIDDQYYFHVIDPLTKMSNNGWVKGVNLVTHLTGPIFWAESKVKSSNPFEIAKDDVLVPVKDSMAAGKGSKIKWG